MGYIEGLGYKIYRLRQAKTDCEYILYNIENKVYNEYSYKKLSEVLAKEVNNFDEFVCEILNEDVKTFMQTLNIKNDGSIKLNETKDKAVQKYLNKWIKEEHILLDNLGFYPVDVPTFERNNKTYLNIYKIPETLIYDNYKLNKPFSFTEFKKKAPYHYSLLKNLHNNDDKAIFDTLYKLADKIKYPQEKGQDCIIFYPGEGAGKGIFYQFVLKAIFGEYCCKVLMKRLTGDFNAFLRTPLVLVLEEGKREPELIEVLKEITTEGTILVNEKQKSQSVEDIYFLTIVFSNNTPCIDLGKRRGSYHLSKSLGKNITETSMKGSELVENLPNETKYLLQYLHNLEIEHKNALIPYNTIAKTQITDLNKAPIELFYDFICSFPTLQDSINSIYKNKTGLSDHIINIELHNNEEYISKDYIKEWYNQFCILEGFKFNTIRHNKDISQLWNLVNLEDEDHKRITVKKGINMSRKLDHVKLSGINNHIKQKYDGDN